MLCKMPTPPSCEPQRPIRKRGKHKALSILEAKIGHTVYHMWRKQTPFDPKRFLSQ